MSRKLEAQSLTADLAALNALLERTPAGDFAGRMGLESRRREVEASLERLEQEGDDNLASVALFFGGKPVSGSRGIEAEFAGNVISSYQDLVAKICEPEAGQLAAAAPAKVSSASRLHVTEVLHGSFGFLLEEIDDRGTPLFRSPLAEAVSKATRLIVTFNGEKEEEFETLIDTIPQRVFSAVKTFLEPIHRDEAVFRMVQGETDASFDEASVERAYQRARTHSIEEDIFDAEGELLGVIPIARRFEFRHGDGNVLRGSAGVQFSQSYLERIEKEQLVGKRWRARIHRRQKKKFGKTSESLTLLELHELDTIDPKRN